VALKPTKPIGQAKALYPATITFVLLCLFVGYDYLAQESGELSFKTGDIIQVLEKSGSGWNNGELRGHIGMYPANYTEEIKQDSVAPSNAEKLRAIYDYQAGEEGELSMKEGDVITLIEKVEEDGWWKVTNS
jgi:hypothetical protein